MSAVREETTREAVVAMARAWIGTPYRHQGATRGVGSDCLGLVRGVWRELYGKDAEKPAPYRADWANTGGGERLIEAARRHCGSTVPVEAMGEGDIVLFRWRPRIPASHAGILSEPTRFIHAYEGMAVTESALVPAWRRRIAAVFRFPGVI